MSTFPSILTTYTNPQPTDKLNSPSHSGVEIAQNSGIGQVEAVIGVEGSSSIIGTFQYLIKSPASDGGGHVQTANKGGTGQTQYTKGDILIAQSQSVLSKLTVGADGLALVADSTAQIGLSYQGVAGAVQIQNQQYTYARSSMQSASVYAVTPSSPISILSDGLGLQVKFATTNTTSILALSVGATGPSSIAARIKNVDGTNPIVGAIQASMIGEMVFDSVSSVFQLQNTYLPAYDNDTTQFLRGDGTFNSIVTSTSKLLTATATDVNLSATANSILSYTIPGSTLGTNNVVRVRMGIQLNKNTSADNLTFKATYGGNSIITNVGYIPLATWGGILELNLMANSSTSLQKATWYNTMPGISSVLIVGTSSVLSDANQTLLIYNIPGATTLTGSVVGIVVEKVS